MVVVLRLLSALSAAIRPVYCVGAETTKPNAVTLYRGLPYEGPFGIRLYSAVHSSGVTLANVPPARRGVFTDHRLRNRRDAQNLVLQLERGTMAE